MVVASSFSITLSFLIGEKVMSRARSPGECGRLQRLGMALSEIQSEE